MSAFMVEDKTISRILGALDRYLPHTTQEVLEKMSLVGEKYQGEGEWQQALGEMMFALNIESLKQRYEDGFRSSWEGKKYQYSLGDAQCSKIQGLKSLRCWLYQCMEGDIPEKSELYKIFDEVVSREMALSIVNDLDEYDKADWG